ncbi:MAG: hypothetical protein HYX92_12020 [Chloroflexi bacterium]|nr:hypothetical protein [Chloroflexota bacterium]
MFAVTRFVPWVSSLALILSFLSPSSGVSAEAGRIGKVRWAYYVGYEADSFVHLQRNIRNLDYISPYWFEMDGEGKVVEGGMRYTQDPNKDAIMALTRANGVKVLPMIKNSATQADFTPVLADPTVRSRAIEGIAALMDRGYDGINIDFENVDPNDRLHLSTFMAELAPVLRAKGKIVSQAVAARAEERLTGWAGAYDYKALGESNDFVVLMAYAYRSPSSATPGSTAPMAWVENSLAYLVSQVPVAKVVLGVAWYGYDWNRTTGTPAIPRRYSQVMEAAQRNGASIQYSDDGSPLIRYTEGGQVHEIWFENRRSVEDKLALVGKYNVAGAAGWRMGQEDPEVWQAMNASLGFRTWLLAEGSTAPPYQTWVLIQNPNAAPVQATVTFMKEGGDTLVNQYRINPTSRFSIFANEVVPNAAFSTRVDSDLPVIVERAMYFGYDGHASAGVNAASRTWYLPEGFTGGMDTWVLLMNPNPAPATATVSFLKEDGAVERRSFQMNPTSRLNVFANQIVPGVAFSTKVEADLPIVAERATYFNGGKAGHGSVGVPYAARNWYLAEGFTGGMDTYILLMNPGSATSQATVTFMKESGENVVRSYSLKPTSRFTIQANSVVPGVSFATRVEANRPIVVERAMYFNSGEGGHSSMGVTAPASSWFLAEGSTAPPFTEYVLMMNPNPAAVAATAYFMKDDGQVEVRQYTVAPNTRFTLQVNTVVPNAALSIRIEASQPVVVERAMYFGRGGTDTAGVSQ